MPLKETTAQEAPSPPTFGEETRWGFQLGRYQDDFAVGLNLTSPYFANGRAGVRLRGNVAFHEHLSGGTVTWSPYGNVSLGLIGVSGRVGESIRLYGEGGLLGLFPSDDFSSETFEMGGYGLFGFSFFSSPGSSYFIELGGAGIGARADALSTNPVYSNGLVISVGFRSNF